MVRHKHRINPGYKGGDYSEGNVVEVSVTQHAMWHFANWQLWGNKEDWLAWKGLSGQIGKEEISRERMSLAAKKFQENNPNWAREGGLLNGPKTYKENFKNHLHPNIVKARSESGKKVVPIMNSHPNTRRTQLLNTSHGCNIRKKRIRVTSIETGESWEFPSVAEACNSLSLRKPSLARLARGERKSYKGYNAEYI